MFQLNEFIVYGGHLNVLFVICTLLIRWIINHLFELLYLPNYHSFVRLCRIYLHCVKTRGQIYLIFRIMMTKCLPLFTQMMQFLEIEIYMKTMVWIPAHLHSVFRFWWMNVIFIFCKKWDTQLFSTNDSCFQVK